MSQKINWEKQWEAFAANFHGGLSHIDLTEYGAPNKTLLLAPGPGFGDLSHPTTQLMMEIMKGRVTNKNVLDIGSGSGILSIAAAFLGAKRVFGIDIDSEAVMHGKRNVDLNHLGSIVTISNKGKPPFSNCVILMNMILSEQREVMKETMAFRGIFNTWIISGILEEQLPSYVPTLASWGLSPSETHLKDGWAGLICS